jgi:DNA polymerase I-like protein with 3'-5' exonuclease and polymerase domains
MLISIDTETTGIDIAHGATPFLVTTCDSQGTIRYWEWDVDPLTRKVNAPAEDVAGIVELLDAAELVYLHNAKFDARALASMGIALPWHKVRDTLIASHLLATNRPHDLTWLCIEYLGVDIEPHELHIKRVTQVCRSLVKRSMRNWRIADHGEDGMPSVKPTSQRGEDKPWRNDMWLPRALAKHLLDNRLATEKEIDPDWFTACANYANADSEHTLFLGLELERLIQERGYWKVYEHRLRLPQVACEMESYGVTAIGEYTQRTIKEFEHIVAESEDALKAIAQECGHNLELPKGAALNDNLRECFYGATWQECPECDHKIRVKHWLDEQPKEQHCPNCAKASKRKVSKTVRLITHSRTHLNIPVVTNSRTGNPTLDAETLRDYLTTLDDGPALEFVSILLDKRAHDTALTFMRAYQRYWLPVGNVPGYYRIHPSLNPCGTDHLRWASNSPNLQNVAGESKEISNRACFGPLPGREWWRMDYKSIENRLPAYESGEEQMVELFERPKDPPFYGSYYLLNASITCPDLFWPLAEREGAFKREQPLAYKHVKFGTLAMQYGCGEAKADKLYRMPGAYRLLKDKLPKLAALQTKYLLMAERLGYVETLPDRTVDPERGYPVLASRTEDGRVLSTTPFNYHISGTACWAKNTALVRCIDQCAKWRAEGFDAHVVLEVHDELLFDFPRGKTWEENYPRALVLKGLMEQSGANLIPAIPTPVSVEYHDHSWAEGRPC